MDDRVDRLPVWARELIHRLEIANEPAIREAARARSDMVAAKEKAKRLSESNEALLEILRCAGRGGSDWAAAVVSTLEDYEIYQNTEGVEDAAT